MGANLVFVFLFVFAFRHYKSPVQTQCCCWRRALLSSLQRIGNHFGKANAWMVALLCLLLAHF